MSATVVAGRYQLERELARGGMGTVWLARDQKLGRQVAVKVMAQELAQMSEALRRFEREAMALAGLRSSHVVEVYDYGVQEGLPYIVMEMLEGENLSERLKRLRKLDLGEVNRIVAQVCKGLKAAHGSQLIHRDLKPSNIFLARRDDTEVVKLLDFGVVKALDTLGASEATQTGILLGTPQYMSPEQARATRDIDHRSDLWSVGVITFRMLTGTNPFRGDSVGDVVLKICSDALPQLAEHRPDLGTILDPYFERAFKRKPDERFQAAHEMSAVLEQITRNAFAAVPQPRQPAASQVPRTEVKTLNLTPEQSPDVNALVPPTPPQQRHPLHSAPSGATPRPPLQSAPQLTPLPQQLTPAPQLPLQNMHVAPPRASAPSLTPYGNQASEPTPISTTVGGTQLAPQPTAQPNAAGRMTALVVGGAAGLITLAIVVAVWVGSGDAAETAPAGASSASPQIDDDAARNNGPVADPTQDTPTPVAPESSSEEPSTEPSSEPEPPKPPSKPSQPATTPPSLPKPKPKPKPKPDPKPDPKPEPDTSRPDWGLGD